MDWNQRCITSIRREKEEAEKKYNIKIGQTNIKCVQCGKPWGFGSHTCADVRLQKLNEAKAIKDAELTPELCEQIKAIGRRRTAVKLGMDHHTVTTWIRKGSVPLKYRELVIGL